MQMDEQTEKPYSVVYVLAIFSGPSNTNHSL